MNFGVAKEKQELFSQFNETGKKKKIKNRADRQMTCLNKLYKLDIKKRSVILYYKSPR